MEAALAERGVIVERGVEAVSVGRAGGQAIVEIQSGEARSTITADSVLGAGGAGSLVRESLGISFDGEAYDEPWRLYDLELEDVPMPRDEANIVIHDKGGMFLVRHHDNLWRVLGNVPEMLSQLPTGTKVGRIHWESDFGISNRVAGRFAEPPFYLAGDAAHIHSGIGARGMNLGIEDAYVFAELYDRGQLDRYDSLRRPVVEKVVSQIKRAMGPPRPATALGRLVRSAPWLVPIVIGLVRKPAQRWILGLDHELGL
jgi:2-polyprenyl-6-methoxyphenol hydroxylase-like FAD-dependent oxidoreductase